MYWEIIGTSLSFKKSLQNYKLGEYPKSQSSVHLWFFSKYAWTSKNIWSICIRIRSSDFYSNKESNCFLTEELYFLILSISKISVRTIFKVSKFQKTLHFLTSIKELWHKYEELPKSFLEAILKVLKLSKTQFRSKQARKGFRPPSAMWGIVYFQN